VNRGLWVVKRTDQRVRRSPPQKPLTFGQVKVHRLTHRDVTRTCTFILEVHINCMICAVLGLCLKSGRMWRGLLIYIGLIAMASGMTGVMSPNKVNFLFD
jgi:hypothetical protein